MLVTQLKRVVFRKSFTRFYSFYQDLTTQDPRTPALCRRRVRQVVLVQLQVLEKQS